MARPRKALGRVHGMAVRFGDPAPPTLLVGEGIETVLSIVSALPDTVAAAALSAGSLGAFAPPPGVRRLVVARDNDPDGERAAERLARRCAQAGVAARIVVPDPAPAISRSKVEKLHDAYTAWQSESDAREPRRAEIQDNKFRFRSSADFAECFRLPSYVALQDMFRKLTGDERAALLALGWFAREEVADWPRVYERAEKEEPTTDEKYQIGCAYYWLTGLERWEEKPRPFQAGRMRRRMRL